MAAAVASTAFKVPVSSSSLQPTLRSSKSRRRSAGQWRSRRAETPQPVVSQAASTDGKDSPFNTTPLLTRRAALTATGLLALGAYTIDGDAARAEPGGKYVDMPGLKGKDYGKTSMKYPDYTMTPSGLQYKDLRPGTGESPSEGDQVVVDWDGFTIGYYGRIFEARNKAKGGSFEGNEKDFYRFVLGSHTVIPAFEEAVSSMQVGGIRRIIVTPDIGYPNNSFDKGVGPVPGSFSGKRALDFVLKNAGLIDKTLLFDIELLRVVKQ
eukprot:jgi/Chlat1/7125/Chrsp57S06798